ncbi:DUF3618 domain-containing protein [Jannaschia sp. W003]|uniref:DUF3618 domain-containing protein n=1 Tax=Jannaschia sp. W003 TaxID=2867012 RepID=UPI0021A57C63|nr:DUF3618 domain-containing protein [Jannaschia sp. W003]UWQ21309.1 DUF3618 domain-containing protein [Jannaschia sp. W003]
MSDDRTPEEIEREIEEERHALARSLEDLQDRFSPERILDQATGYVRENGSEFADRLVVQVKNNPIAATMAGVGIAWLLATSNRPPQPRRVPPVYDRNASTHDLRYVGGPNDDGGPSAARPSLAYDDRDYPSAPGRLSRSPYPAGYDDRLARASGDHDDGPSLWERAKDKAGDLAEGARDALGSVAGSARSAGRGASDRAHGAYDATRHGASDVWGTARSGVSGAYDGAATGVSDAYHTAGDRARHGIDEAGNSWSDMQGQAADRWGAATAATSDRWQQWQGGTRAAMTDIRNRTRDAQGRFRVHSSEMRARIGEGTEHMSAAARERVIRARAAAVDAQAAAEARLREASRQGRRMYDDQPLVGGLIAFAVGAMVGAALPRTEFEDEHIGVYRDRAMDEAERVFNEEAHKLRAVADAALDEARDVADEKAEGVRSALKGAKDQTPSGDEAVRKAENEAKSVAQRVADAAREEAERQNLGGTAKAEADKVDPSKPKQG